MQNYTEFTVTVQSTQHIKIEILGSDNIICTEMCMYSFPSNVNNISETDI